MIRAFVFTVGVIAFLGVGGLALKALLFPLHTAGQTIQTAYDLVDETVNAENAIYNYEWFKQQKEDIEAKKRQYKIAENQVETYIASLPQDRSQRQYYQEEEYARLSTLKNGILYQIEDMIAKYNARGQMANRAIFKDGLLPSYIEVNTFIFGG